MSARCRLTAVRAAALAGLAAFAVASEAGAQPCRDPARAIGVSRVLEIDAAASGLFGRQQYPDEDPLKDGEIILTFDDGPLRRFTVPVIDALAIHCTRATFFMVGRMAVADPAMVQEIARRGHSIATHTWSHRNLKATSPANAAGEMELGISAVKAALGGPITPFFRFPYLADPKAMIAYARSRSLAVFSIDVDANDYRTPNPRDVYRRILAGLAEKRKGILLFHDIQPSTAGAILGLLDELKERRFKVVHIVAKAPAASLPEYDAQAAKLLEARRTTVAARPLADRSVVWPLSGSGPQRPGDGYGGPAAVAAPPPLAAPEPVVRGQDDWAARAFRPTN